MARVTVDDCLDAVPNRFELVLLAATRSRQLSAGQDALISKEGNKNPVTALREIAEGKILISHLQEVLMLRFMGESMLDDDTIDDVNLDDVQDFNFFTDDDAMVHEVDPLRADDDALPVDDTPPIDELI